MTARLSVDIKPCTVVGFNGKTLKGLQIHSQRENYLYTFGHTLVIKSIKNEADFYLLHGHANEISCMQVSHDGKYLATGQKTYMGFKTNMIVWEYGTENIIGSHDLHKAVIESVAFTSNDKYVISLGGDEFEKGVLVWSFELQEVLCGCQASQGIEGIAHCLASANVTEDMFVTAGERTIRVWQLEPNQVTSVCVMTGHLKRDIRCIEIDKNDLYAYCGTTSGDILKIRLDLKSKNSPNWAPNFVCDLTRILGTRSQTLDTYFACGVTALSLTAKDEEILIGTGNGMIYKMDQTITQKKDKLKPRKIITDIKLLTKKEAKLKGRITSIVLHNDTGQIYVGADEGIIFMVQYQPFTTKELMAAHKKSVSDVTFPNSSSKVFITASEEEIRIWGVDPIDNNKIFELRKIIVKNATCSSVHCMADGHSIVSGWNDGKLRIFAPESGKLLYSIPDSHRSSKVVGEDSVDQGVTAVSGTSKSDWIISGGGDGKVCVWKANPTKPDLIANMKEHKGAICAIKMHSSDQECVSASVDGTCIIWDFKRFARKQIVFASTIFRAACYGLEECQLLTGGTDNNISYWEVHDGSLIRHVKAGARMESIQSLDLMNHGNRIITGSSDSLLRVWSYHKGSLEFLGRGHGAAISKVQVDPDNQCVVSVGKDGSILRWRIL